MNRYTIPLLGLLLCSFPGDSAELTIKLSGSDPISRNTVTFDCGKEGAAMGLPAQPFRVEYLNGAGNSLAILPIRGQSVIFVSVVAGSGARYASGLFVWWDAGSRGVHLYSDAPDGKKEAACRRVAVGQKGH